jgi:SulP family sulfate permease
VVLATLLVVGFHLDVATIGSIPQALPMPHGIPHWQDFGLIRELINPALALAALGSIKTVELTPVCTDSPSLI